VKYPSLEFETLIEFIVKEEDLFAHQERKDIPPDGNVYATIP
jgi:hypothetical protein